MPTHVKYTLAMFALTAITITFAVLISRYLDRHKED